MLPCHSKHVSLKACCATVYRSIGNSVDHTVLCRSSVVCEGHKGCLHNILYEKAMVLSLLGDCNRVDLHDCMARRSSTIVGEEHMDCFHSTPYEKAMSFLLVDGCNRVPYFDHTVLFHSKPVLASGVVLCYCSTSIWMGRRGHFHSTS